MDPILESDQCHLMSSFKEMNVHWINAISGWWLGPTPLKNMKVSLDDYSQWKNKKCSKPPTSILIFTGVQVPVSDPFDDDNVL